jgi:hypothetical protein
VVAYFVLRRERTTNDAILRMRKDIPWRSKSRWSKMRCVWRFFGEINLGTGIQFGCFLIHRLLMGGLNTDHVLLWTQKNPFFKELVCIEHFLLQLLAKDKYS